MAKSPSHPLTKIVASVSALMRKFLPWAGVMALLLIGTVLSAQKLWRSIARRPEFIVDTLALDSTDWPRWVNEQNMAEELRRYLSAVPAGQSIFAPDLAQQVHLALRKCPWLLEVPEVKRQLPNKLLVTLTFRKPAGLVQVGEHLYLVDIHGYWLREDLFRRPTAWGSTPPVILDRLLRTPPTAGKPWDEPRLAVGARLMDYFSRKKLFASLPVTTIDVTGVGRTMEPDIVLLTAHGTLIKWGSSSFYSTIPGLEEPFFAVPDSEKLALLQQKLKEYPELKGVKHLDLRFPHQVALAPQEAHPATP